MYVPLHSTQFVPQWFSLVCLCLWPLCALCVWACLCLSVCLSVCLSLGLFLWFLCLSVTPDFPCLSHNSHPSYTAAQPVEERWARCQAAGAPVGQSISSIKDMLSTRVYPPGLEPWSPVQAPPHCPSTHSGALGKVHRVPILLYQHGTQASRLLL